MVISITLIITQRREAGRKQSSDLYNEIMSKCPEGGDYWGYE